MIQPKPLMFWPPLLFAVPLLLGLYWSVTIKNAGEGLPLDDAYIYLQYIENIQNGHGFSFNAGEVSFGVTSFLYTVFCAIVNGLTPFWDAMAAMQWSGIFWFLVLIAIAQHLVWRQTGNLWLALWCGVMLASCRPLYFTAPAGLEASMFCAFGVINFYLLLRGAAVHPVWLGVAGGALFLTRPEGLIISAGYLFFYWHAGLLYYWRHNEKRFKPIGWDTLAYLAGWLVVVSPYSVFVKLHSGFWLPTTFYGKLLHLNEFTLYPLSIKLKEGFAAMLNAVREIADQDPTAYMYYLLFALTALSALIFAYQCGRRLPAPRFYAARAAMLGVLALPFLFGFQFHVYPQFGGYFVRYIQIVIVLIHLESALALHGLLLHGSNLLRHAGRRRVALQGGSATLAIVLAVVALPVLRRGAPAIPSFYFHHLDINEGVRKQAAYWLRDHTPANATVLVGTTGLGVVGGFSQRYSKDEAGLINPDIHQYLKAFHKRPGNYKRMRSDHWAAMLEYMKIHNVSYYTSFDPLWFDTRFTRLAVTVSDPSKFNTEVDHLAQIYIYRYDPPKDYTLWPLYGEPMQFQDLAAKPINENRVKPTFWNNIPILAVDVRMVKSEISGEFIFPDQAQFKAGLALDYPPREYDNEWIQFQVEVEIGGERKVVYSERFEITEFEPRETLKKISIDLSEYSNNYGKLILSQVISPKKAVGVIWAGWVNPRLVSDSPT